MTNYYCHELSSIQHNFFFLLNEGFCLLNEGSTQWLSQNFRQGVQNLKKQTHELVE